MRILLDYRPALVERTGVGEYTHELATALVASLSLHDTLTLFSSSWKDRLSSDAVPGATVVDSRIPVRALDFAWHRLEWPPAELLAGEIDIAHSTHPLLMPARRAAQVITIHDLFFLDRAEGAPIEVRRDYPSLVATHARRADRVVVVSKYTAGQVESRLGVPASQIALCPPGAPAWQAREPPHRPGFILYVGSTEPRKNVSGLLRAYARLVERCRDALPLVMAGPPPTATSDVAAALQRAPLAGKASHIGYIADMERLRLYRDAAMLVIPSLDEGFGMPALEAMRIGVPVVASNRGALPEVVGDAGLFVEPGDDEALAVAMRRMMTDQALARASVERGIRRAATYTWSATARNTLAAYEAALARRRERS